MERPETRRRGATLCALALLGTVATPRTADAFCGFYVAGSSEKLFNDATQVVLMRHGTRTVLAMQNHYKGPLDTFAMVIPVPVPLREADVKTLPMQLFERVNAMGAPRLVEYWERDPCDHPVAPGGVMDAGLLAALDESTLSRQEVDLGVKVEAQFAVGEYKIVILSAKESTGLEAWLRQENYSIPKDAEPLLRPYVESGSKWFVAKVDPAKVKQVDGRAALSPLRFHYDSDDFSLPIRLGLANSSGKQDLIVNIFAPHQRYEVANYDNVRIPTNIDVRPSVKGKFAELYAALFDRTVEKHPRAVVTEYAWDTATCDPCPGPTLDDGDLLTLGADVLEGARDQPTAYRATDFVHTRLHARYGKELTDDLRFKTGNPIAGGREHLTANGKLEEGAQPSEVNNFQARYAIRHAWNGPITCNNPVRDRWGGPDGKAPDWASVNRQRNEYRTRQPGDPEPAMDVAFAKRDAIQLPAVIARDVPELDLVMQGQAGPIAAGRPSGDLAAGGGSGRGGCCGTSASDSGGLLLGLGTLLWLRARRRPHLRRAR